MKRTSVVFLQVVLVLIGVVALILLAWFPLVEGRATNLDLLSIYLDPLILYMYAVATVFFVALYKSFRLLSYVAQNRIFSTESLNALRNIKYCAIIVGISILLAGLYIRVAHHKDDDPAGFLAICMMGTFVSAVIATAMAIVEKILQNAVDMKSENDLTI
jgi:fatty acid desaturase